MAIGHTNDQNAAVDGAVAIAEKMFDLIPLPPVPGLGAGKTALKNWIAKETKDVPPTADWAIPFHKMYSLVNAHAATDYDATRAGAFINTRLGIK